MIVFIGVREIPKWTQACRRIGGKSFKNLICHETRIVFLKNGRNAFKSLHLQNDFDFKVITILSSPEIFIQTLLSSNCVWVDISTR